MKKFAARIFIFSLCSILTACSTTNSPAPTPPLQVQNPSGFLPDYNLLKPIPSPKGSQIYLYKNPKLKPGDYHAAIVDPVSLYRITPEKEVSSENIEQARATINAGIQKIISQRLAITDSPGPGVLRVKTAITGARLDKEGFKPWNIIPISALIKLTSMATDSENKTPVLIVELKIVDSQTAVLLEEIVAQVSGEEFRNVADTAKAFAQLSAQSVQQALNYSSNN